MEDSMVSNMRSACPPITSVSAGALPRYGTCTMRVPARVLNSSADRWVDCPLPDDAKVSWPARCLARAMSSLTLRTGRSGRVTMTSGPLVSNDTGVKLFCVS
ncbi:hypothetical protein D3C72_1737180 [compost metagenome]